MALSSSSRTDLQSLCSTWFYPKYTCYSAFAVLSFVYTISVHALFQCGVVTKPKIQCASSKTNRISQSIPQSQRVAIVTGSNTGVGLETAKQLVLDHDFCVILACRSGAKARAAAEAINSQADASKQGRAVFLQECDLSSFASVKAFAETVHSRYDKIDVLVNNAGLNTTGRTEDGYDLLFQACFLGHFLLTNLMFDLFPLDGSGRIVNLSSIKHHFPSNYTGFVSFDESYWRSSALLAYRRNESYPNAKQAAIFFTLELNRRYSGRVRAFAANPGAVNSSIWRSANLQWLVIPLFRLIFLTTEQGAATSVAAAVGDFDNNNDFYLQPYWMPESARRKAPFPVLEMLGPFIGYRFIQPRLPSSQAGSDAAGEALWKVSEELTGLPFDGDMETKVKSENLKASTSTTEQQGRASGAPAITSTSGSTTIIRRGKADASTKGPTRPAMGLITNTAPTRKKKEN
ncbi:Short-chain dehydrogenase TIC 32, chloroplastic [Seminavis robusta]|uniref:Short-chain dehydrogenase TIC 32, chloroplastic n=1 Tax=Seminavis robusta TaxID=568900 RepID=A0A9N8H4H2_9STRA|nr:Short-chain dehydrogenase TIC 32, chloroplastic [Seminavis robusta]|eukprot:Sro63_g035640.1 Short-chain dehydrogenase TIC 32, chloroplastic (460) ;mRNA; r:19720-21099